MPSIYITLASAIFILSSAIGLWYSVGILPRYVVTYRETSQVRNAKDRTLSEGLHFEIMVGEIVRCIIHMLFLVAGLWSLILVPPPPYIEAKIHVVFDLYFLWSLVAANVGITINTLVVRRGYRRRRGEGPIKLLPSRDHLATILRDIRLLKIRQRKAEERIAAEELRNDRIEEHAGIALLRADAAERRADTAHDRADTSEADLEDHEERIEVVEEVVDVRRVTKKKTVGKEKQGDEGTTP